MNAQPAEEKHILEPVFIPRASNMGNLYQSSVTMSRLIYFYSVSHTQEPVLELHLTQGKTREMIFFFFFLKNEAEWNGKVEIPQALKGEPLTG